MLTRKIVALIEANAGELARDIEQKLLSHPTTRSYRNIDQNVLHQWIYDVCSRFGYWLSEDNEKGEVREHYRNLGRDRFNQGFELPEVISALYITKRRLWEFIAAGREADATLDLNQIVETSLLLVRFFDHAVLYVTRGYEEMFQKNYGYAAALEDPHRLAQALAAKRRREETAREEPRLPTLCFTKGMIRRPG